MDTIAKNTVCQNYEHSCNMVSPVVLLNP